MAVLQIIRNFFTAPQAAEPERIVPAAQTAYAIRPLTRANLDEVLRLNMRCFPEGENYTKHTFSYLLNEPGTLSYRTVTESGEMAGFVFVMVNSDGAAHITTVGVAPEHRRRRIAERMLAHLEYVLRQKGVSTIVLEVRIGNIAAQDLYRGLGYIVMQRLESYYNNGEDGLLMLKSLV